VSKRTVRTSVQNELVGREREMAELRSGLEEVLSGQGRLFLVTGEPGIGKTRLSDELAIYAASRAMGVVRVCCWAAGAPAYWPFLQVIRALVEDLDHDSLARLLNAGNASQVAQNIAQLIPELRQSDTVASHHPAEPPPDGEQARFRLFESVAVVLRNSARRKPLMVFIDDLHEADEPSLLMLRFIARQLRNAPVLLVGTYREAEVRRSPVLSRLIGELMREGVQIQLFGLSRHSVQQLVEKRVGATANPRIVSEIHQATAGNPLFIEGIVRLLIAQGGFGTADRLDVGAFRVPDAAREAIRRWLTLVSDRAPLVVGAAIGLEFDFRCLQRVTGYSAGGLLDLLRESVDLGILIPLTPSSYRFAHALIRNALSDEITSVDRSPLHLKIAQTEEELYQEHIDAHAAELARHFREAGELNKAIDYSIRAGEAARVVFAYEEAIALWQAALELMSRGPEDRERRADLLERLGELLGNSGAEGAAHIEYLKQAATLYEDMGRREAAARVHARLGGWHQAQPAPDFSRSIEHSRKAQDLLSESAEGLSSALLHLSLASTALQQMRYKDADTAALRAMDLCERLADEVYWIRAANVHASVVGSMGKLAEASALLSELWTKADQLNDALDAVAIASIASSALLWLLDPIEAEAWGKREWAKPRKSQVPFLQAMLFEFLGRSQTLMGKLREAGDLVDEGRPLLEGEVLFYQGEWPRAEQVLAGGFQEASRRGEHTRARNFCDWLVKVRRALGDNSAAEATLQENLPIYIEAPDLPCELHARLELALLYAETARPEQAHPHLVRCRELMAAGEDWRGLAGHVARAEGAVAAAEGRFDAADSSFAKAVEIYRRYRVPFEQAEALHYWGRALAQCGDQGGALEKFDGALDLYQRHGAGQPWLERVRADKLHAQRIGAATPATSCDALSLEAPARLDRAEQSDSGGPQAGFRKEGQYWSLTWRGSNTRLRDAKGFQYIAYLIRHPGQEFAAQDLVSAIEHPGSGSEAARKSAGERYEGHRIAKDLGDAGVALDFRAKSEYRRRLAELREELADAQARNDLGQAAGIHQEINSIEEQLTAAVGLGGRDRKVSSHAERARLIVTKAIKSALARIREADPQLGRHLALSIRTGNFCSYGPTQFLTWQL
jgi:tetratricopeptide (TPR) repeat protein